VAITALAIGIQEELVFRGYLLTQWRRVSGSWTQAIAVTSLLFGLSHIYQGWWAVVQSFALAIVFAVFFRLLRRLWPLAFAHALLDFVIMAPP
jgi:membrane protease YdiL (CAAX protease family)